MKEIILKKLKKEFLPFQGKKVFESQLEKNFKDIKIFKMYGSEVFFVNDNSLSILFIQKNKELVILLFSDYNKYKNNRVDENKFNILPKSVSKIDIIASKGWEKENQELLSIVKYISKYSSDTRYDYFHDIPNDDFNSDFLFSPIYWQLTEKYRRVRSKDKKNKSGFFNYTVLIIINSLSKKIDIENINVDNLKKNLFTKIYYGLLNEKRRPFVFNEIVNYRNKLLSDVFYLSLFKRVKYNQDEWNVFFETEVFENFNEEFFDFVKELELDQDNEHKKIILNILIHSPVFETDMALSEKEKLVNSISDQYYLDISNDIHDNLQILLSRPLFRQRYNEKIDKIDGFELATLKEHSKFYDLRNTFQGFKKGYPSRTRTSPFLLDYESF